MHLYRRIEIFRVSIESASNDSLHEAIVVAFYFSKMFSLHLNFSSKIMVMINVMTVATRAF